MSQNPLAVPLSSDSGSESYAENRPAIVSSCSVPAKHPKAESSSYSADLKTKKSRDGAGDLKTKPSKSTKSSRMKASAGKTDTAKRVKIKSKRTSNRATNKLIDDERPPIDPNSYDSL
ncbi:unnamed protein product [Gongylonema pulchrum]|uniref:Uncharacterized protein n=1 Tax=Gongylonema pulchrum TaxID=637853 RepID=A0A3P7MXG5_9BILA|nr:unnamed protein product [Gongylonema pulchrum]